MINQQWTEPQVPNLTYADMLKITGVCYSFDDTLAENKNFEPVLANMRRRIGQYSTRALSLLGRILTAKACLISLVQFLAETIEIPEKIVNTMQKEIDKFVWKGQRKMAASLAQQPLEKGGLAYPRLKTVINTAGIKWLVGAKNNQEKSWVKAITKEIKSFGGYRILNGNLDIKRIEASDALKDFKAACKSWKALTKQMKPAEKIFTDESVWTNLNIIHPGTGKTLNNIQLRKAGFKTISDFFDINGNLTTAAAAIRAGVKPYLFSDWNATCTAIKRLLGDKIAQGTFHLAIRPEEERDHNFFLISEDERFDFDCVDKSVKEWVVKHSRYQYNPFRCRATIKYNLEDEDWDTINKWIRKHSKDTWTRSYIYRISNGTVFGNSDLFRFGHRDSPKCQWCLAPKQNFNHLTVECRATKAFKTRLTNIFNFQGLQEQDWILGHQDNAIKYILLEATKYTFIQNFKQENLDVNHFLKVISQQEKIERNIALNAQSNSAFLFHGRKWTELEKILYRANGYQRAT